MIWVVVFRSDIISWSLIKVKDATDFVMILSLLVSDSSTHTVTFVTK